MAESGEREVLVASLRCYLEDLLDTGVADLPFGLEMAEEAAAFAPAAVAGGASSGDIHPHPVPPLEREGTSEAVPLFKATGNPSARLAFVMAGDGFTGEAGELLARMVPPMGFSVEEVYLITFDEATPPSRASLVAALHKVDPEAVMALGDAAAQILLDTDAPLHELRGAFSAWEGAPVMPTWHPQLLLTNQARKREAWHDIQLVMRRLGTARPQ